VGAYSYVEFRRLPDHVRREVLRSRDAMEWFKRETSRHGGDMLEAYDTRFGKLRHRLSLWVLTVLT